MASAVLILRWSSRTIGTLVAVIFLMFLLGEGFGPRGVYTLNLFALSAPEFAVISLRLVACFGLLLAWRWEALGGGITLTSMVVATILRPWVFVAVVALSAPAAMYLLTWFLARNQAPHGT
jgi:hypothetical protein